MLAGLSHGLQLLAAAGSAAALPDRQTGALILLAAPPAGLVNEIVTLLKAEGAARVVADMEDSGESARAGSANLEAYLNRPQVFLLAPCKCFLLLLTRLRLWFA
jgi:hypothetical protein